MAKNPKQVIEGEVVGVHAMQLEIASVEAELMQVPQFKKLNDLRKALNDRMAEIRANVEAVMVPAYVAGEIGKSVKGDWGSATVVEGDVFAIDEALLPKKFWKTVVDTTKIRDTYHLEGKPPKGTTPSKKYSLRLDIK